MEFEILLRLEDVTLHKRGSEFVGTLSFTQHHFFFRQNSSNESHDGTGSSRPMEIWVCYPMIDRVDFHRGSVRLISEEVEKQPESFGLLLSNTLGFINNTSITNSNKDESFDLDVDYSNRNKNRGANIRIQMRDFTYIALEFKNILRAQEAYEYILKLTCIEKVQDLYAFSYKQVKVESGFNGWELYNVKREFERQGIDWSKWRISDLNKQYSLCDTYPRKLIIPAKVGDSMLSEAVKYRSKNRFPALSYYYAKNGCTITRCAQPLVGIKQNRSIQDENLVMAIFETNNKLDARNLIVDARPVANATAQMALGAGSENVEYYGSQIKKIYLNIDNIHVMRDSLNKIKDLLKNSDIDGNAMKSITKDRISKTGWIDHIRGILKGVENLTKWLTLEGVHILIHCSDGWDRTSQISSLVQICCDPYFRTLEGICVLIEKEWCSFGHRFNDRCGHLQLESKFYNHTEPGNFQRIRSLNQRFQHHQGVKLESPVFLQFLDCIYQLIGQHPEKFEYNERFLRRLLYHLYSCQYGTFLGDCELERSQLDVYTKTQSVWGYFLSRKAQFTNPGFVPHDEILDIGYTGESVQFWYSLYQIAR